MILRLSTAAGAGGIIGLNRDLAGKPIGVRTLGLVSLGAAVVTLEEEKAADEKLTELATGDINERAEGQKSGRDENDDDDDEDHKEEHKTRRKR